MKSLIASAVAAGLSCLAVSVPAHAQDVHTVHFPAGETGATIHGSITGDTYIDYRLAANQGQAMDVILKPETIYFNVMAPGGGDAIFNGSMNGAEFGGTLPASGTYTIRVYQMGAAADEGKTRKFTLEIGVD